MFDKLEDLLHRYEEIMNELSEPGVANDTKRFTSLMKEQSDLTPIVEAYKEYRDRKQTVEDSEDLLAVNQMKKCVKCSKKSLMAQRRESKNLKML